MNVEQRQAAVECRPSDHATWLGLWVRLYRLLSSTTTIAIYYYYSARKLILIYRPTEGRRLSWPASSTRASDLKGHRKSCIIDMCNDLQAESSGWIFKSPLAGVGAYCGGPVTGRTECFSAQTKQAVREAATICPLPLQVDLWPFDLESGVRVTCDVFYLCANFRLLRPLCSRVRPDVRVGRQTDRQPDVRRQTKTSPNASALYGSGGIMIRMHAQNIRT